MVLTKVKAVDSPHLLVTVRGTVDDGDSCSSLQLGRALDFRLQIPCQYGLVFSLAMVAVSVNALDLRYWPVPAKDKSGDSTTCYLLQLDGFSEVDM